MCSVTGRQGVPIHSIWWDVIATWHWQEYTMTLLPLDMAEWDTPSNRLLPWHSSATLGYSVPYSLKTMNRMGISEPIISKMINFWIIAESCIFNQMNNKISLMTCVWYPHCMNTNMWQNVEVHLLFNPVAANISLRKCFSLGMYVEKKKSAQENIYEVYIRIFIPWFLELLILFVFLNMLLLLSG